MTLGLSCISILNSFCLIFIHSVSGTSFWRFECISKTSSSDKPSDFVKKLKTNGATCVSSHTIKSFGCLFSPNLINSSSKILSFFKPALNITF